MTDWTAGYVAEVDYTYGYYTELNPLRTQLAFLYAGLEPPSAQGTHCELGFGQGLSVNIHASASGNSWHGCDFNPSQARFARSLASASGAQVNLTDEAFADFCARPDLPEFDSIGLHGIWSWVNDDNRAVIVEFVRRRLKVGGVLYISYNTQPGWAAMAPMRDLLTEHVQVMGSSGQGIGSRVDGALDFVDKLLAVNPRFVKANPHVAERVQGIRTQNRNYVAHEYFNRDWLPMSFSQMAQWLSIAKVDYACSANYSDHILPLNLTSDQISFLNEIPDRMFRQTARDFLVNQSFRKDYWTKGVRKLNPTERVEALRTQRVVLVQALADVPLQITCVVGEITMQGKVYKPILEVLADHQSKTLGQLEDALRHHSIPFEQMVEAVMILIGNGSLASVQDDAQVARAKLCTDRLNAYLLDKARSSDHIHCLASPLTGGGIPVSRFAQLFLLALRQGKTQPDEWGQQVWQTLQSQGQKLMKSGKVLGSDQDDLAELTAQARTFAVKRLPVLRALQVV